MKRFVYKSCILSCMCLLLSVPALAAHTDAAAVTTVPSGQVQSKQIPAQTQKKQPVKAASAENVLRDYNHRKDAAPQEPFPVVETNFKFNETLLVRPKTDMLVIHHVGIPDGDTSAAAIHKAHLANGWAGIGYHYVIRKDGSIERGRPLATVGAHAEGQNYHTVGINVTGNFEKETPTQSQIASLEKLLVFLCQTYDIHPSAATIVGHRNVNSTDCPGKNLYKLLPEIRDDVALQLAKEKLQHVRLLHLTYPRH